MLADNTSYVSRHNSDFSNSSVTNILGGLYDFLRDAELQDYFQDLHMKLKVRSIAQLKYVDETDLQTIGMTRPEMRRLKKYFSKEFPQTAMDKIKKRLSRTTRSTSVPRPEDLSSRSSSFAYGSYMNGSLMSPIGTEDLATIASVATLSIEADPYDWRVILGKHAIQPSQLTIGPLLHHGYISDVYKGHFRLPQGQIPVAIKVISKESIKCDVNDLLKEISRNCYLDHVNVFKLYGISVDDVSIRMVTELAPCGSLNDCLAQPDSMINYPVTVLYGFSIKICEGMAYLERRGEAHGRLIGRNVLIFPNNQVRITDVGLFRACPSLDKNNSSLWISPELRKGCKESSVSDVWAFGVLLCEMYSYYQKQSSLSQVEKAISTQIIIRPPLLSQPDLCPGSTFRLLNLCWTDNPKDRPSFSQLSSELDQLEPEIVVALINGPDPVPTQTPGNINELSEPYSLLPKEQKLLYKSNDKIIVLDRSNDHYQDVWRGCLLTGEFGYFKSSNVRTIGIAIQPLQKRHNAPSPAVSLRASNHVIGETFAKIRISRRDDKRKTSRVSIDMIGSPLDDFRHVGHVGPNGDVFGDVTSLYANSGSQKKVKSGSVSVPPKVESLKDVPIVSRVLSTSTLHATGVDTSPYSTLDPETSTPKSKKSKDIDNKISKKDNKHVQLALPISPIKRNSEDEADVNAYLDELTICNDFSTCNASLSMFEELSKQWDMQVSKLGTQRSDLNDPFPQLELFPSHIDDYSEVYDDTQPPSGTYEQMNKPIVQEHIPKASDDQKNVDVTNPATLSRSSSVKSSLFNKFRVFGTLKKTKDSTDDKKSPVYAKVNKTTKVKKSKEVVKSKRNIISNPILISGPMASTKDDADESSMDCSSEVSSLQPSPRDSVLCLSNAALAYSGNMESSLHFNRQLSNVTNNSRGKATDSTTTTVSPASSFASLTSTPANSVLQGGAALRALRKGDCVFRASSAANALNRKRPSIHADQCSNDGTIFRPRQPSLPSTSYSAKVSTSTIDGRRYSHSTNDQLDPINRLLESTATTTVAPALSSMSYAERTVSRADVKLKLNHYEEEDIYNSLHSGSLKSDNNEPHSFVRHLDVAPETQDQYIRSQNNHRPCRSSITEESNFEDGNSNGRPHAFNKLKCSRNFPNSLNVFDINPDNDEVAL